MKRKSLSLVVLALLLTPVLQACDPGAFQYGYAYNPKYVLYRVFESLRDSHFDRDWGTLFTGKMACYYSSPEGIHLLQKTMGDPATAYRRFLVGEPELIETGPRIRGYRDQPAPVVAGELYRTRVTTPADGASVLTVLTSCFQLGGAFAGAKFCTITGLENHRYGNPAVPECEGP